MIDHKVLIGGADVSNDVVSIKVKHSNDVDSDPGKIEIVLANRKQKYTNRWPPQIVPIEVTVYNWVYRSEDGNPREKLRLNTW